MAPPQDMTVLSVELLTSKATNFVDYVCVVQTAQNFYIKFYVKYSDGSDGFVYGGPSILGKVSSESELLQLHEKIWPVKALLKDNEWDYLRRKYGIRRDKFLVPRRDKNLP